MLHTYEIKLIFADILGLNMTETVILILIVICLLLICVTVIGALVLSGLLHQPEVHNTSPPIGKCRIAYKFLRGGYSSSAVSATFTEAISIFPTGKGIGIFYDDPGAIEDEQDLRCAIGCIISENKPPDVSSEKEDESLGLFRKNDFRFFDIPQVSSAVVSEFPYTSPLSVWLAPQKVYPAMGEFIAERGLCAYPMLEIYSDTFIQYMLPLSKQDDFSVPECSEDYSETCTTTSETASHTENSSLFDRVSRTPRSESELSPPGGQLRKRQKPQLITTKFVDHSVPAARVTSSRESETSSVSQSASSDDSGEFSSNQSQLSHESTPDSRLGERVGLGLLDNEASLEGNLQISSQKSETPNKIAKNSTVQNKNRETASSSLEGSSEKVRSGKAQVKMEPTDELMDKSFFRESTSSYAN